MNLLPPHHKKTLLASGLWSIIYYVIYNEETSHFVLDVQVCRGPEIEPDHCFLMVPFRIAQIDTKKNDVLECYKRFWI
jgi:hypothetical protein